MLTVRMEHAFGGSSFGTINVLERTFIGQAMRRAAVRYAVLCSRGRRGGAVRSSVRRDRGHRAHVDQGAQYATFVWGNVRVTEPGKRDLVRIRKSS